MIDVWIKYDFLLYALTAGIAFAVIAGPLGSIVVWRRMAYFGDTLAHSTLLGVGVAYLLHINYYIGMFAVCVIIASLLATFTKQDKLATDTVLGIISHVTLAIGLLVTTALHGVRIDLIAYLFGDILAVNRTDIVLVVAVNLLALGIIITNWRSILLSSIQPDLAKVEGINVDKIRWIIILTVALVFSIAIKLVGVLLITSLLIIPSSAARQFAKSPEQMAFYASLFGILAVISGLSMSLYWDLPTGPSIVVSAFGLFISSLLIEFVANQHT